MEKKRWTNRSVVMAGLFAAFTAVSAQIAIPAPPVPFTLQVLAVLLSGAVLGARTGALSQGIYLFMGGAGLPVFAGRSGGIQELIGPSGGYLIGFVLAAWVVGRLLETRRRIAPLRGIAAMLAGLVAIYLPGLAVLSAHVGSWRTALSVGLIAFVPADLVKAAVAYAIARGLEARGIDRPAAGAAKR